MKRSTERILTSHAGSLPRPPDLIELNQQRIVAGVDIDPKVLEEKLRQGVQDVVRRQVEVGVDIPNDGEYGHAMPSAVHYGAWWSYIFERLDGLELTTRGLFEATPPGPEPGRLTLTSMGNRRDRVQFAEAYADPDSGITVGKLPPTFPVCRRPLRYVGQAAVARDIANAKAALAAAGVEDGFLNAVAPGSCARFLNEHYATEEEFIWAAADVLREEYKAIVDSGLMLQLDDPCIAENWDQINPAPSVADYQRFTMVRVEALNHAIRDLPTERIRFHLCWGSWHGPHVTDLPMKDIVDVMLKINAGTYLFEAGNVRHEHEWRVWREVKLPDGKVIVPGVVSHATNLVEHPEVVADRIVRFAEGVGRENVIAGTDCGLGGRVHPQLAWAKLEALAQGAELASQRLWS
ncbi:MAG: cobalamin-independent methionine synthase II family protein [Micromonosporaceae bacterium]|nr:cobalamin-independent methionine synthase II family protein [Micromonosporaceae bacterium]